MVVVVINVLARGGLCWHVVARGGSCVVLETTEKMSIIFISRTYHHFI